jgi:hypothetical protein
MDVSPQKSSVSRLALSVFVLCGILASGLLLSAAPAMATELPEVPVTEGCGGPVSVGSLHLCGTLNPNASAKVGYYFAYNTGASCTGGGTTPPGEEVEGKNVKVSAELTGLQPGTQYTYCVVATNSHGETFGNALSVTTEPQSPSILNETVVGIAPTTATLEAQIRPNGEESIYYFEYSVAESLGGSTIVPGGHVAPVPSNQTVSATSTTLAPSTTYYYRVVTINGMGTSEGPVRSFVTSVAPQEPTPVSVSGGGPSLLPSLLPATVPGPPPVLLAMVVMKAKPLTRAQKFVRAVRLCNKKPKHQRPHCLRLARRKYGSTSHIRKK